MFPSLNSDGYSAMLAKCLLCLSYGANFFNSSPSLSDSEYLDEFNKA